MLFPPAPNYLWESRYFGPGERKMSVVLVPGIIIIGFFILSVAYLVSYR